MGKPRRSIFIVCEYTRALYNVWFRFIGIKHRLPISLEDFLLECFGVFKVTFLLPIRGISNALVLLGHGKPARACVKKCPKCVLLNRQL